VDEIAGMYCSKHCADRIFFRVRPGDGFVVTKDDAVSREVGWVQERMEQLESNGCVQRSKRRNPEHICKGAA
jgi:hypothetical protein